MVENQFGGGGGGEKKKERKEKRKKKKRKGGKTKVEKKIKLWGREKWKRERGKEKIFPVFRRSELNSLRTKVGSRNESYMWVSKSEFFVEAPRGRGFLLYWFLFI